MVFSHKPSTKSIYNQTSGNTAQTKANTSQEPPNKTKTLSSGTSVRKLFQMIEMKLVNLSFCVISPVVTLGWPVVSQMDSLGTLKH